MSAPRIAIAGVLRRWEDAERAGVNAAYVRSVVQAGGVPVILSQLAGAGAAARALDGCEGLILTGGEDVHPRHYGADPHPALRAVDSERDRFEIALVAAARARRLPVLGICRGIQVINVALGGTLWQDLPSERPGPVEHDSDADRTARAHPVRLAERSRAAAALGVTSLVANSFHHQAVRDLAPGLVASGWSPDGLIEAVESPPGDPWLLAVQWHPEERHADTGAPDRGLFRALVREAARWGAAAANQPAPSTAPAAAALDPAYSRSGRAPGRSPD